MFAAGGFGSTSGFRLLVSVVALLATSASALAGNTRRPARPDGRGSLRWIEPVFETRYRTIVEPAVFETRSERVWIEPQYRNEQVRVVVPAVFEQRSRRVWRDPVVEYRGVPVAGLSVGVHHGGVAISYAVPQAVVVAPGHWETICERVCVQPECVRMETKQVCVQPGRWEVVERHVCVKPECSRVVAEQVCIAPGRWESADDCGPAAGSGPGVKVNFSFHR